jgi:hypothetical protein
MIDAVWVSILENEGPSEVYFKDSHGNTYSAHGPLTEPQLHYLLQLAFARDPAGTKYRDPEFDARKVRERLAAKERGEPWYIDRHPEEYTREARFKRHGISLQ